MKGKKYCNPRVQFSELKHWVLDGIYSDYRGSIPVGRAPFDRFISLASIAESYRDVFERPIENLMVAVIFVVLGVGNEKWERYYRGEIEKIVSEYNLYDLLAELESEERSDFSLDLAILGYSVPESKE